MISHKHRCAYIHIPKTAGKSINALFGIPEFGRDYVNKLEWIEDPYDHHRVTKYQSQPWFSNYLKFTVVRNPWDRLVSAFFYLERGGSNQGDQSFRDEKLARYGGNFEAFALELPRFTEEKFFRPATYWLSADGDALLVNRVLRFENLAQEIPLLVQDLNLESSTSRRVNATTHPPFRNCYTHKTRDIVREIYSNDIDLFNYDF